MPIDINQQLDRAMGLAAQYAMTSRDLRSREKIAFAQQSIQRRLADIQQQRAGTEAIIAQAQWGPEGVEPLLRQLQATMLSLQAGRLGAETTEYKESLADLAAARKKIGWAATPSILSEHYETTDIEHPFWQIRKRAKARYTSGAAKATYQKQLKFITDKLNELSKLGGEARTFSTLRAYHGASVVLGAQMEQVMSHFSATQGALGFGMPTDRASLQQYRDLVKTRSAVQALQQQLALQANLFMQPMQQPLE